MLFFNIAQSYATLKIRKQKPRNDIKFAKQFFFSFKTLFVVKYSGLALKEKISKATRLPYRLNHNFYDIIPFFLVACHYLHIDSSFNKVNPA